MANANATQPATTKQAQPNKDVKVATTKEMSFAELRAQIRAMEEQLAQRSEANFKARADEWKKIMEDEEIDPVQLWKYWGFEAPKAARKPSTRKASSTPRAGADKGFVRGTTYAPPKGVEGKEWTAGGLGAKPKWLAEATKGLTGEALAAKYREFAKPAAAPAEQS